ncbi:hypothetical protein FGIG_12527 [Fasciola gigantica]|uniref:FAR1 domain-containing protein n=1 Tax=Fasciola gigantica TaxID=46835 RepID=A0A504Z7Y2_FASGI|nr:hypothetical protein FGIG_12527 [Fasciola gigantica]
MMADHTVEFKEMLTSHTFPSLRDFRAQLDRFQRVTNTRFTVRSSKRCHSLPGIRYSMMRYTCHLNTPRRHSKSVGLRRSSKKGVGCPARFFVVGKADGIRVTSCKLKHNHNVELSVERDRVRKQLTQNEKTNMRLLLQHAFPPAVIKTYIQETTGKSITNQDVCNMRLDVFGDQAPLSRSSSSSSIMSDN